MDYACEDFSEIARRLREIEGGRSVEWGLWYEHEGVATWTFHNGMGQLLAVDVVNATRFVERSAADQALAVWARYNPDYAHTVTVRELPPLPASDTA